MHIYLGALLLLAFSAAGCCSTGGADMDMNDVRNKMDAPLRARLHGAQEDALVGILLQLEKPTEAYASKLIADGLQIQTITGAVVAAHGSKDSILRAAARPFVLRLELSRERPGSHP